MADFVQVPGLCLPEDTDQSRIALRCGHGYKTVDELPRNGELSLNCSELKPFCSGTEWLSGSHCRVAGDSISQYQLKLVFQCRQVGFHVAYPHLVLPEQYGVTTIFSCCVWQEEVLSVLISFVVAPCAPLRCTGSEQLSYFFPSLP